MRGVVRGLGGLVAVLLLASGCLGGSNPRGPVLPVRGEAATDLEVPWGVAFLPDGGALVAERDSARILLVRASGKPREVGRVPDVEAGGEGGLLGLAVSPHFDTDHRVYAYHTTSEDNRIVRMTYQDGRLSDPEPILTGIPAGALHNGGRIAFGPDGNLYAATGEAHHDELAQDLGSLGGKVLRMTPDGKPAPGNPYPGSVVFSYGHRNVEGLAFDSHGRLWASEFGANAWDELNLIRAGGNYGWPIVEGRSDDDRFVNPVAVWRPDEASPSGIAIVDDVIYMAALRGERLWRMPIQGTEVGRPVGYFIERYGRLRTAEAAPDGTFWLTTSNRDGRGNPRENDDRILRVDVSRS
jgi:glucose/arabinose dehydrogenase